MNYNTGPYLTGTSSNPGRFQPGGKPGKTRVKSTRIRRVVGEILHLILTDEDDLAGLAAVSRQKSGSLFTVEDRVQRDHGATDNSGDCRRCLPAGKG